MTELISQFIVPITIVTSVVGSVGIATLIFVLRDKISGVYLSRSSLEIRTNDVPEWSKIVDRIERIDSNTCKTVRKATVGLMVIDPEIYGMSPEAMLVIREANLPLIYATYENHHTRELVSDGGDVYLADKANDILDAVQVWKQRFPELTYERAEAFVCHWFKKILIPTLRRACMEKVAYYSSLIDGNDVSKTIKTILEGCRQKNLNYIHCIDELSKRSDIAEKSAIFFQTQNSNPTKAL
jgi:hypothetical protein